MRVIPVVLLLSLLLIATTYTQETPDAAAAAAASLSDALHGALGSFALIVGRQPTPADALTGEHQVNGDVTMAGDQARTPLTLIIGEENMVRAVQNSLKGEVPMSAIPLNDIWQRTDIVPNAAVDTTEQPPSIPDTMPEQQASQQKVSQQDASQQQVSQQQATQPQDTQSQQLATQPQAVDQPALNNVAPMPAENVESPSQQQPVPLPVPVPASLPLSPGQTQTPLPSPVTPVTPVTPVVSPTVAPRITTVTDVTRVTVFTSTNTTAFVTATSSQHSVPTVNGSSTVKQSHLAAAILTFLSMIYYAIIT